MDDKKFRNRKKATYAEIFERASERRIGIGLPCHQRATGTTTATTDLAIGKSMIVLHCVESARKLIFFFGSTFFAQ
jgi:hypothetical protein